MHSLSCLLTVQSPVSNPKPSQQLCTRLVLCSTGILSHVYEACELLESVVLHRGWGGMQCLHMLAVHLPLYIRVLASSPIHGSHAARGMVQLLSSAWRARKHTAFCISSFKESAIKASAGAPDRTSNECDAATGGGDLARNLILAWAIGLSLPHSSSLNPLSSSSASLSLSLSTCLADITKIHDYFVTLVDHPKSTRINLLDTHYCYEERAVSTLIVPTLKLFINRAIAEDNYEREMQSRELTMCGKTDDTPTTEACTTSHLLDALLGSKGDHFWTHSPLGNRLDATSFLRLAVTLHSYSMKGYVYPI